MEAHFTEVILAKLATPLQQRPIARSRIISAAYSAASLRTDDSCRVDNEVLTYERPTASRRRI